MTTAAKELEGLSKRRADLVDEAERLREEGGRLRLQNQPTDQISKRLSEIEGELPAANVDYKEARRAHGQELARKLAGDAGFQATLREALGVLMPLVALSDGVNRLRGQGVALDVLPRPLLEVVAATKAYVEYLVRRGVLKEEE